MSKPTPKKHQNKPKEITLPLNKKGFLNIESHYNWWILGVIIFTIILYKNILNAGFIYYSDDLYILNNDLIKDFSVAGIKKIFVSYFYHGYIPITLLTYAIEYHFWGDTPYLYLITSLFFHLINTYLVFRFIHKLTKNPLTGILAALFFAIHPMHVESVLWIAERKDLLFVMFYLIGAIYYISYLKNNLKIKYFIIVCVFLLLSMLSKPSALTFPALLALIDYYYNRKFDFRAISEKVFQFVLIGSLGLIYYINFPRHVSDLSFTFIDRIFMGGYSFLFYFTKAFAPFNLSLMRPYPPTPLPTIYYIYTIISVLIVIALLIYIIRKLKTSKILIFGLMFFLIHISFVLHIGTLIGGVVIVADRYTYLPYLGFFFIAGEYYCKSIKNKKARTYVRPAFIAFFIAYTLFFSYQTWERIKVWDSPYTIYEDAIKKNPDAWQAYNNLGYLYTETKEYQKALPYFDKAIALRPQYMKAYFNRGTCKLELRQYEDAIKDFDKSIESFPFKDQNYFSRGLAKYNINDFEGALKDYNISIRLNPKHADAYNNRGWLLFQLEKYDKALSDFNSAIALKPDFDLTYNNRGWLRYTLKDYNKAIADFDKALQVNPNMYMAYINRGWTRYTIKDYAGAISDFSKAMGISPQETKPYMNRALAYIETGRKDEACKDWNSALNLGYYQAEELINKFCKQ